MASRLGILAGGGGLPARLVGACRRDGRDVFVLAFEGQTDPATVQDVDHAWTRLGQGGAALAALRAAGVDELVMAGAITRPSLSELRPDLRTVKFLAKIGVNCLGDDGLLRAVVAILETEGFRVIGVDDVIANLPARPGPYGMVHPDATAQADIARGIAVVRALGAVDVGQAAVVQQGIVLGVEAAEGTDALLDRCAGLRRKGPGGVLVKLSKPGQEARVDLPTVGVETARHAAAAGLAGIAVQAGGALVVDPKSIAAEADRAGLFVVGVEVPE